jgi:hypothetical protein
MAFFCFALRENFGSTTFPPFSTRLSYGHAFVENKENLTLPKSSEIRIGVLDMP